MGDKEDVERRKQLSNTALYKLKNIWIGKDKINHNIKIKLYEALVKSILTYNCGTWALAQTELNKLDAFHRGQLRKVLNIYYPTKTKRSTKSEMKNHYPLTYWKVVGAFSDISCVEMRRYLPTKPCNYIPPHLKKIQGKTNYNTASDHQQRPVTNPRQPITEINRRFEIPSITGTGP